MYAQINTEYYPLRNKNVKEVSYNKAIKTLQHTYANIISNENRPKFGDYWNIATSFFVLKEDPTVIQEYLMKAKKLNPDTFDELMDSYNPQLKQYLSSETPLNKSQKSKLIEIIKRIGVKDQMRKSGLTPEQGKRDAENLAQIDSLYGVYQTYIGRSMVGKENEWVMWAVIHHSNINAMERYLPVIHEAVENEELNKSPLRLLIDRIYTIKCGVQIYGTQGGFPLAPEEEISKIEEKYHLPRYKY